MCTSPVKITNPKYRTMTFQPQLDKEYLFVPCGQCEQCQMTKQDEYFVRAYYEYLSTKNDGGFSFFETFTYDKDHVPMHMGLKCFRKSDFQKFMKRLRFNLVSDGIDVSNGKLRYLVVSEYGENKGQPHYHAIFNCHFKLHDDPKVNAFLFKKYLHDSWCNGLLDNEKDSKNHKVQDPITQVINDLGLVKYVTKYVSKPQDWIRHIRNQEHKSLMFSDRLNAYLKDSSNMFILFMDLVNNFGGADAEKICNLLRIYNKQRRTKTEKEELVSYLDNKTLTYRDILRYERTINAKIDEQNEIIGTHNDELKMLRCAFPHLDKSEYGLVADSSFLSFHHSPIKMDKREHLHIHPFVQMSHGYGQYYLDSHTNEELESDLINGTILMSGFYKTASNPTGEKKMRVPRYYIRKTCFDYDSANKKYRLNELGVHVNTQSTMQRIETTLKNYKTYPEVHTALQQISSYIKTYCKQYLEDSFYKSHDLLACFHKIQEEILQKKPLEHFVKYVVCLKDYKCFETYLDEKEFNYKLYNLEPTFVSDIVEQRFEMLSTHPLYNPDPDEMPFGMPFVPLSVERLPYYNEFEAFRGYDTLAELYTLLGDVFKAGEEAKLRQQRKVYEQQQQYKRAYIKPLFNPLIK